MMGIGTRPGAGGAAAARLVLLAVLVGASGCSSTPDASSLQERTSGDSVVVEVNSKAPAFAARTLDGGTVRLAEYVGSHVVLLEFWSIFCKSCIEEMPHIEALHEKYAADGLAVFSVNTDVFSTKRIASFMEKAGIHPPYPILRDQRQAVAGAFGVGVSFEADPGATFDRVALERTEKALTFLAKLAKRQAMRVILQPLRQPVVEPLDSF